VQTAEDDHSQMWLITKMSVRHSGDLLPGSQDRNEIDDLGMWETGREAGRQGAAARTLLVPLATLGGVGGCGSDHCARHEAREGEERERRGGQRGDTDGDGSRVYGAIMARAWERTDKRELNSNEARSTDRHELRRSRLMPLRPKDVPTVRFGRRVVGKWTGRVRDWASEVVVGFWTASSPTS